ncbi:MAG: AAA family ATPase [Sedimentisphaerales bacterium]|nr:AAA family ATPase [Sedimentisphaerales bacterium]
MLTSLHLENYRAFSNLKIDDLSHVNIFVGKNNCGKTSILEAVEMLLTGSDPSAIIRSPARRGEIAVSNSERRGKKYEINHLFHGHLIDYESRFKIEGIQEGKSVFLSCEVVFPQESSDLASDLFENDDEVEPLFILNIESSERGEPIGLPMSASGNVFYESIWRSSLKEKLEIKPINFVRSESIDRFQISEYWDSIALTDKQDRLEEILRIIEPGLDKIAFLSGSRSRVGSYGVVAKLKNIEARVPLGSLGDGIKHILVTILAAVNSTGGTVLIDEIDTGLHYSVMTNVWKILIETAKRLNIQIFATTHSLDCLRSLAWLHRQNPSLCETVRLHRVEKESDRTVAYSSEEVEIAIEQLVEMR